MSDIATMRKVLHAWDDIKTHHLLSSMEAEARSALSSLPGVEELRFSRSVTYSGIETYGVVLLNECHYDALLVHPNAIIYNTVHIDVTVNLKERAYDIPVTLFADIYCPLPEEEKETLIRLGKIKWHTEEPKSRLILTC